MRHGRGVSAAAARSVVRRKPRGGLQAWDAAVGRAVGPSAPVVARVRARLADGRRHEAVVAHKPARDEAPRGDVLDPLVAEKTIVVVDVVAAAAAQAWHPRPLLASSATAAAPAAATAAAGGLRRPIVLIRLHPAACIDVPTHAQPVGAVGCHAARTLPRPSRRLRALAAAANPTAIDTATATAVSLLALLALLASALHAPLPSRKPLQPALRPAATTAAAATVTATAATATALQLRPTARHIRPRAVAVAVGTVAVAAVTAAAIVLIVIIIIAEATAIATATAVPVGHPATRRIPPLAARRAAGRPPRPRRSIAPRRNTPTTLHRHHRR